MVAADAASAVPSLAALVSTRAQYNRVAGVYAPIAIAVFAIVVVITLTAVAWFRRRPVERAARWSENNLLEAAYAAILACVVAVLLYVTFSAEHKIDTVAADEKPGLIVDVTGAKWEWRFNYPAYGINRYSGSAGHQTLVVPIDTAVLFRLRSIDVIHAFYIPELDFKRALIPGATNTAVLTFTSPGSFSGQCAEFCGLLHYAMTFTVQAVTPAAFGSWLRAQRARPSSPPPGAPDVFAARSSR